MASRTAPCAKEFLACNGRVVIEKPFAAEELLRRIDSAIAALES